MDKLLEKTRQAVAKYKLRSDKDKLSATKALWFALRSLRKAMKSEPEQEKLTLEMARELSELVGAAPGLLESAEQAEETARLPDDKRSADEFIAKIEAQLRGVVNQLESDKSSEINTWLESQPVLNELSKSLAEKMPESTYVLLFRGRDRLHIMTSQSPDGRIFTRFRAREFQNRRRVYRMYHRRPPVGAVIVSEGKINKIIGRVPQPAEGEDQLQLVATMSKEAASLPAKKFVAANHVLQVLHEMYKDKRLDKSTYVLLFMGTPLPADALFKNVDQSRLIDLADDNVMDIIPTDLSTEEGEVDLDFDVDDDFEVDNDALPNAELEDREETGHPAHAASESSNAGEAQILPATEPESSSSSVDQPSDNEENDLPEQSAVDLPMENGAVAEPESAEADDQAPIGEDASPHAAQTSEPGELGTIGDAQPEASAIKEDNGTDEEPEIFTKVSNEGAVITRFYANEFSDVRKLFDTFAKQRTVCGAAVIRGNELVEVIGRVPQPQKDESQFKALMRESNHAADKPTRDFLDSNEILSELHKLASGELSDSNAKVVLFTEDEQGRLAAMTLPQKERDSKRYGRDQGRNREQGGPHRNRHYDRDQDRGGRDRDQSPQPRSSTYLSEFRYPREIRSTFKDMPRIVGASVIGEMKSPQKAAARQTSDDRGKRDGRKDQFRRQDAKPRAQTVVLMAFGRTPLKQNILITDDTIRRLGLDIFI